MRILFCSSIENIIIIIKGKNACKINSENKHFIQELKIQEVEVLIKLSKAKGNIKINICTNTYLME